MAQRSATFTRACTILGGVAVAAALAVPVDPAAAQPPLPAATVAAGSSITVSAEQLRYGQTLQVDYATDQPHQLNWVGVYRAGQTPGSVSSTMWEYTPAATGSVSFTGLAPGDWQVFLLARDGYDVLAGPVQVEVLGDPAAGQPGDPDAPVTIDPVATDNSTDETVLREGFGRDRDGWTVAFDDSMTGRGADAYRGWRFVTRQTWTSDVDGMRGRFGRAHETIAVADAEQYGDLPFSTTLTSAPVPVTGLGAVRLTFDSHYRGAPGQSGVVRVSFDGGRTSEVLRLDSASVDDGYDALQMNHRQDVTVEVPLGAESAVFSWELSGGADARYWAIDSVTVHEVLEDVEGQPTQAWVMSDIQGHPHDWQHAIGDYAKLAPDADGMLLVGDIVNTGRQAEWDEIYDVMDATSDVRPEQTVAAIGNHERYAAGGFAANRDRFLAFADRDRVWDEYVLEGPGGAVPVIVLGQEFASPSEVAMSDEQVEFLEERLAHWTAQDRQVLVLTHFPLGDTVSASWLPWYHDSHMMNDRLTSILGNYPNAIVLSGHTHYPAELGDWAVQRRTGDGHADGFWAVNTLAMHVEWDARGESSASATEIVTRDVNRGLTVDAYGDRVVVTAHDFATDEQLRQVVIPNPLVGSDTVAAPAIEPGEPRIVSTHKHGVKPGAKLVVDEGEWSDGVDLSYRWLADGRPIAGETGRGFHLTGRWKGVAITVEVTGTRPGSEPVTVTSPPVVLR
ncbi:DUF4073 domain-containing protein [Nocardioides sp. SYSU DS0651]|uniref:DUF4073 domain-containing protein n=1 Tax=Nocardioides sp. SYSU DS0651 TaxID=3415955 RepID=UPI003F4C7864